MKYFIDTEFIGGFHKPLFGKKRHFIDLISMGIVAEDGREYYAISKDFDLKSVWNKYDLDYGSGDQRNFPPRKVYWLRDNVLKPVVAYLDNIERKSRSSVHLVYYSKAKRLINKYGKSNKQIAEEIISFVNDEPVEVKGSLGGVQFLSEQAKKVIKQGYTEPEFYGYYADYDWMLFCSLFGRMIDLPKGFPMYCRDLKQMLDEKVDKFLPQTVWVNKSQVLEHFKTMTHYPKQTNEHNALADAKWNLELYNFLKGLGK